MKRFIALLNGRVSSVIFFVTLLYTIGFVGNILAPKFINIQTEEAAPLVEAALISAALLALFAIQHSEMARPEFKRWWTEVVPRLILLLLFWQWRSIPGAV